MYLIICGILTIIKMNKDIDPYGEENWGEEIINPKQGYIFVPYIIVEKTPIISEGAWSPKMKIKSRYTMTIVI